MDVEWVLLASSAMNNADGTVSLLGAGLVNAVVPVLPYPLSFSVVTRVKFDPSELPTEVHQRVQFLGAEGNEMGVIDGTLQLGPPPDPSHPVWINLVQTIVGVVTVAGGQSVAVSVNGADAKVCPLQVHVRPPES